MQKSLTPLQRTQLEALGAPLDFPPEYISWLEEFVRLLMRTSGNSLPTHGVTHLPDGSDPIPGLLLTTDPQPAGFSVIYDYTVGTPQASIDTNVDGSLAGALSQDYDTLELALLAKTDEAVDQSQVVITVNNDTGSNYDVRELYAYSAATVGTASRLAQANWEIGVAGGNAGIVYPSMWNHTMPAYAATTFNKAMSGQENRPGTTDATNVIAVLSFGYRSTSAVTRFKFACKTGGVKFVAGSRLTIWAR